MSNVQNHINKHNNKIHNKKAPNQDERKCNCKEKIDENGNKKKDCPLSEKCLTQDIAYKAVVTCQDENENAMPKKVYHGLTEQTFKARYTTHKSSFKHRNSTSKTALSTYIWKLKDRNLKPKIKWSIKAKAFSFSSGSKKCNLCLTEKLIILHANQKESLNKRDELLSKCTHMRKFKLVECKPD